MTARAAAPSLLTLLHGDWSLQFGPTFYIAVLAALYLSGVGRLRGRWPVRRTLVFLAGLGVIALALESGIDAYDERLLSVHMVQHMLLLLVAPALLILGRPVILLLRVLPAAPRRMTARALVDGGRRLARPLACLAVLWLVILGTHVPAFYDSTLLHPALHLAEHAAYLFTGLLFWWPLLDGDPSRAHRLGGVGRLVYAMAAMPPMAIVGAYLDRHLSLVYAPYGAPTRALGVNPLADQAQAGAIMWVGGGTLVVAVTLYIVWRTLIDDERRQRTRDDYAAARAAIPDDDRAARRAACDGAPDPREALI